MVKRHNRLLVAFYVSADALLGAAAFLLAYALRFRSGLLPVTKGYPPFSQYVNVLPFIAILVPLAFQFQGLYRVRRDRSRVDDFFAVFIGSVVAVMLGVVSTLYFQTLLRRIPSGRIAGRTRCRSWSGRSSSCSTSPSPTARASWRARSSNTAGVRASASSGS